MSAIVKTKISDGPSKAVYQFYLESGVQGELENEVLLDPTLDFDPPLTDKDQITINQIWYSFSWFDALLTFDALEKFPSWVLTRDSENYFDFRYFGGLKDRSGIDSTGKLFLTTTGFAPIGSTGTIIIEVKKDF